MIKRALSILYLSALLSTPLMATHYKVYVLTGQSNSLGTTNQQTTDQLTGLPDDPTTPGTDSVDSSIDFFWSNRNTAPDNDPAAIISDSGGEVVPLQRQETTTGGNYHWGPEINFGRQMHKCGQRDFLIIKGSRGGGGNGYWLPGNQMYKHVVDTVNACVLDLTEDGHTFEMVGLLYLQGESDNTTEASLAGTRFADLLDNMKVALPNATNMRGYIGGIASSGTNDNTTRANQEAIAASRTDIEYFSNMDLQDQRGGDNLHFDKRAKLTIGARYAEAVLKCRGSYDGDKFGDAYTPEQHGWSRVDPHVTITGQSESTVSPDGATGKNAWNITDASTGHRGYYYTRLFTNTENTDADTNGWHYQLRIRMLDTDSSGTAVFFQYGNGTNRWLVSLDVVGPALQANGNTLQTVHDGGYHTYSLRLTSGTTANLYFDGVNVGTVSQSTNSLDQGLLWGSASTGGQGNVNVNEVRFSVLGDLTKPRLPEFQAVNTTSLQDEDSDYSDWIEVENPGTSHLDLGGFHLTDTLLNPAKWTFPAGTFIAPKEKIIVFASGKNRTTTGSELHTNFGLSDSGGYLALVDSDNTTKLTEYDGYPRQYEDTSYGLTSQDCFSLISPQDSGNYHIPSDGSLGLTWTAIDFDDSTWSVGASGIGYDDGSASASPPYSATYDGDPDNNTGTPAPAPDSGTWNQTGGSQASAGDNTGWHINDNDGSNAGLNSNISGADFDDMYAAGWEWSARIRQVNQSHILFWDVSAANNPGWGGSGERVYFSISVSGGDAIVKDGENAANTYTVPSGANDYFDLLVEGTANSPTGAYTVKINGVQRWTGNIVDSTSFGGGFADKIHSISGSSGGTGSVWDIAAMELKALGSASESSFLFDDWITSDVAPPMKDVNPGLFLRFPFTVDHCGNDGLVGADSLTLSLLADDGYVAYLNGTQIALNNSPASPSYDATSTTDSIDEEIGYQRVDLVAHASLLQTGSNVLAIHALNSAVDASRFVVLPTLYGGRTGQEAYFTIPTPGTPNSELPETAVTAWQSATGVSNLSSDDDGDGVNALLEFVGGTDVTSSADFWQSTVELVRIGMSDYLAIRVRRPDGVGTVDLAIESTENLLNWSSETGMILVSSSSLANGTEELLLRLPNDLTTANRQFLRAGYTVK